MNTDVQPCMPGLNVMCMYVIIAVMYAPVERLFSMGAKFLDQTVADLLTKLLNA